MLLVLNIYSREWNVDPTIPMSEDCLYLNVWTPAKSADERWGAIHSAEMGDGTLDCEDIPHTIQMLELFLNEDTTLRAMCEAICVNRTVGLYDGAYNAVKLAMGLKTN